MHSIYVYPMIVGKVMTELVTISDNMLYERIVLMGEKSVV